MRRSPFVLHAVGDILSILDMTSAPTGVVNDRFESYKGDLFYDYISGVRRADDGNQDS